MARYELTPMDPVWNRACDSFSEAPLQAGDRALRDLLRAHGPICNSGVFHVFDVLTPPQIEAAESGYGFFGLDEVAKLLSRAKRLLDESAGIGEREAALDVEYAALADDRTLVERFRRHFVAKPSDFAPLTPDDS